MFKRKQTIKDSQFFYKNYILKKIVNIPQK